MPDVSVIVPNLNGEGSIKSCIDSLLKQSIKCDVIVVDNGSHDNSQEILNAYKNIDVIKNHKNLGFAEGVNIGFRSAIEKNSRFVATLNNDATADNDWLKSLVNTLSKDKEVGIVTSKILDTNGSNLDSTGDYYTVWGLPYPRGRGESDINKYDRDTNIFAASGGASIYRVDMLKQIGLFDKDFFAYYEDVDISFRAQLAGWKITYEPKAIVFHQIGATSSKIKGFTTYQTIKNLPLLLWKNVPWKIMRHIWPRLVISWSAFSLRAISRGQIWPFLKGFIVGTFLWFKALKKRRFIQRNRKVSDEYIWNNIVHDLPPNAYNLRKIRSKYWKIVGKK